MSVRAIKVLLADPLQSFRSLYSAALKQKGYAVETARNSFDLCEQAKKSPYQVIIFDPYLDGKDVDITAAVRKDAPNALLVAFVYGLSDAVQVSAQANHVEEIFIKGMVSPWDMAEKLTEICRRNPKSRRPGTKTQKTSTQGFQIHKRKNSEDSNWES